MHNVLEDAPDLEALLQVGLRDVGQAEVQVGRTEVTLLQAQNALSTARMRLLQLLGVLFHPLG